MNKLTTNTFRYIPGFDGLRALAVMAVIAYHLHIPYTQGGFHGVTVFFVISGFLITSLLLHEWADNQTIQLRSFWIRRAKRLLPAMFLLLILLNIVTPLIRPEGISSLRQDTFAAFFYYSNWHYIFLDLSYFDTFETPSLLTHFWSLAIEEQFYIVWAVLILLLLKYIRSHKAIFSFIILASLFSIVRMTTMHDPNLDPSRVYYGTDTRMFSLLIGASFALIQPTNSQAKIKSWIYEVLAIAGLLVIFIMVVFTHQYDSFIYNGGMAILSITTAMVVFILNQTPTVFISKLLELPLLKWIGLRSYGIYLWHYPVIVLMEPDVNTEGLNVYKIMMKLILTILLAAISYTFVEQPIRQGKFTFNYRNTIAISGTVVLLILITNSFAQWDSHKNVSASHQKIARDIEFLVPNIIRKIIMKPFQRSHISQR
jgi:peptidoglycan/LPS O-acetylase OafA/YrhL